MTFSAVAQGWRTLIPTYCSTNRWGLTYSRGSKGFVNLGSLYQDFGVVAAWIIIGGLQHDGGICPRTHDNRVYSPKEDKTASYQRRCRCSQSRLRVKGEQLVRISALCETLAFNCPSKEASDTGGRERGMKSPTLTRLQSPRWGLTVLHVTEIRI